MTERIATIHLVGSDPTDRPLPADEPLPEVLYAETFVNYKTQERWPYYLDSATDPDSLRPEYYSEQDRR